MLVSMVNTSGPVNKTRSRETCVEAGFTVSDISFRVIDSIAWFRRIRLESDIRISNRSRPKTKSEIYLMQKQTDVKIWF